MAQSGKGRIEIWEDFYGEDDPITHTQTTYKRAIGDLRVFGNGSEETSSGVTIDESVCPLGGVGVLTVATASDIVGLTTAKMFDVALMGTLVYEVRVQVADRDTKSVFAGFSSENDVAESPICVGSTTTITLTAANQCGFLFDHSLDEDNMWYIVYNGGTTTGITVAATNETGIDLVAGEWDILRVEIDPNGTARWYINGALEATVEGAVSTTANLAAQLTLQADGSSEELLYVDYFLARANRDWTR